jgi:threonine synthase
MFKRCSSGNCDKVLDLHSREMACPDCGDLLELVVDWPSSSPAELKKLWRERRLSDDPRDLSGVWRFREVLPEYPAHEVVTMAEGNCPLVRGHKSGDFAGVKNLRFKHLGWNPTACFKDLGMTVGVTEANHVGATVVGCASTGNTSGSMAAYAARAGIKARVFLPAGAVSMAKLAQSLDYGAEVVQIEGNFDNALDELLNGGDPELYFLNSINPYRIEGQKTVMYELMEQCGWNPPDYVVVPGGNLGNSSAFGKALMEMKQVGLIDKVPHLAVIQAAGANPLARAWREGADKVEPVTDPHTDATAIRIGAPKSWKKAIRGIKFSQGTVTDVSDAEIGEAKAVIGRDGVGCEPASAATLAGIRRLVNEGWLDRDADIVAILTGHVLKDTDYIVKRHNVKREESAAHKDYAIDCCVH